MRYLFLLCIAACGADPKTSCNSMCVTAGFTSGRADVQSNETNCFCEGGTGVVTAVACNDMCKGIGKPGGTVFGSGGQLENACQCQ